MRDACRDHAVVAGPDRRSGVAERHSAAWCTLLLDLTSRSGFTTTYLFRTAKQFIFSFIVNVNPAAGSVTGISEEHSPFI